jgi:YHS domain-containing protein
LTDLIKTSKSEEELAMRYLKILHIAMVITLLTSGYPFAESGESNSMPQKICPVMTFGDLGCSVTKSDFFTDYKGKRIFFCSKGCRETFTKDPEKYMNKLKEQGVVLMDTPAKN